jgi:putative ABC transport system permease protein
METIWQDVRYGLRMLAKNPGFTVIAVLTLALGIGANTVIFSIVNSLLLRPLPYPKAEELVVVWETGKTFGPMSISYPNYEDWRAQAKAVDIAIFRRQSFTLTGEGEPERLRGSLASASLFDVVEVPPQLGRSFRADEDRPGGDRVAILSHGLWERRFGSDEGVLGRKLTLNGVLHTVIGVMPARFSYPSNTDAWVPIGPYSDDPAWRERGNHPGIYGVGRLKRSLEEARAEIEAIAVRLEAQYPQANAGNRVALTPLRGYLVQDTRPVLLILMGAVGLVLLIACANVANLLLARGVARRREVAIRATLGATRWRIAQQFLTESLAIALAGGALGLLASRWGIGAILALNTGFTPRTGVVEMDTWVLGFTAGLSILTGLVFGIAPAWRAARGEYSRTLKEAGRSTTGGRGQQRLKAALVVSEVALALVLLISAGLLTKSLATLLRVDPGFNSESLLTMNVSLPEAKYREMPQAIRFYEELVPRLAALPGVRAAAVSGELPLLSGSQSGFNVSGRPPLPPGENPAAEYNQVTPEYFQALGIPLLGGRALDSRDREGTPKVMLVDESFARKHWPGEDAIGKQIFFGPNDVPERRLTVVGVVGPVRYAGLGQEPPRPQMYYPFAQNPTRSVFVVIRTEGDPLGVVSGVKQQVQALDPDLPLYSVQTMEKVVEDSTASQRLNALLLGFFSGLALVLTAVGLYGVISFTVAQRTHEIGIRVALGALPMDILRLVVGQGLRLTLLGVGLGLAASFAVTQLLSKLLFQISPRDPLTFFGVTGVLAAVALAACWIPARRATRVDPMVALRYE